ncbi:MAG: hypothetical protein ABJK37_04570 [Paraglaciecola sp.]|uniref:hypothetical protein n=1 Tax=Paraglaciecola sp. TaxID=1920173 RepID=UPI0032983086
MLRNPVTIEPLANEDITAVQGLTVKPFQKVYADQTFDISAGLEAGFSVHVIKKKGSVVGMFRVDTRFHFDHAFAKADTPGVRSFIIDQDKQDQGMGTEACRMMSFYLRGVAPMARGAYMLVNVNNVGAYKACSRGGWGDTGEKYILGHTGPQHILWIPLR